MNGKEVLVGQNQDLNENILVEFDLDELEEKLQSQLNKELSDLQFLAEEKEKIGNPDNLGNVIMNVVWEQFLNQVANVAGEDFIKENRGLRLDLRKEAHIQTTENFAEGKIATHNTEINYQERYDAWQSNFVKDENGNVVTHKTRAGKEEATLVKGARKPFDEGRPAGSAEKHTDMDHTVSAAEIIRDSGANAHMTQEEQIKFANSDANLNEMDASLNRSKGDKSMNEWLDNPNANGQKPDEVFNMSEEDKANLRQKDDEARAEYERQKEAAEQRSIEAGKKSRKEEAFRIGGAALRAVFMQMLSELVKEIMSKLVKWLKSTEKKLSTLLDSLKEAIHSFVSNMKTHLINAGNMIVDTVVTAIFGPICKVVKKVWMMFKQGVHSLREAIEYIKAPENRGKSVGVLIMEVGKIITAGVTGATAILLGETIAQGLEKIPIFAFEIPLIGSIADILGIFFGAVVAGIIGAIAINLIEKQIEKSTKRELVDDQIKKGNEVLRLQQEVQEVNEIKLRYVENEVGKNIYTRHVEAANEIRKSMQNIDELDKSIENTLNDIDALLDKLKEW